MNNDHNIFLSKTEKTFFPLLSIITFHLFIYSSLTPSSTLTAALTELGLPSLFPKGSLTATNKPSQRSRRSIQALSATVNPAQKNSQGDFTRLPPRSGPRYQIIQHAPAPCQFGSTSVYFQRNLIWLLQVHFPHNSSRAVCVVPREAVLWFVPSEPASRQSQH